MSDSHSHPHRDKNGASSNDEKELDADGHDHSAGITKSQLWLVGMSGAAISAGFLFQWTLPGTPWIGHSCALSPVM